jgi:membrane-associated protease RseP (regulator of RpoE activity)
MILRLLAIAGLIYLFIVFPERTKTGFYSYVPWRRLLVVACIPLFPLLICVCMYNFWKKGANLVCNALSGSDGNT